MTVTELRIKLQEIEESGKGNIQIEVDEMEKDIIIDCGSWETHICFYIMSKNGDGIKS